MNNRYHNFIISLFLTLLFNQSILANETVKNITLKTNDDISISAYWHKSTDENRPSIILFHQAGASALGEYQDIIPQLSVQGYNILAVDLRSGGNQFGGKNITVRHLDGHKYSYCEAYPDMVAVLNWTTKNNLNSPIVIWGSSYSAALVFKLAAMHPQQVSAVLGFSPASGDPLEGCRPEQYLAQLKMPLLALRPESEMAYSSVIKQAGIFKSHNIPYLSIKNGVHGSSMLVDGRTKNDMSIARQQVFDFIKSSTSDADQ